MDMKWISVSERLPEYTCQAGGTQFAFAIVYCNGHGLSIREAMYSEGQWSIGGHDVSNVTHWMPMPDPPSR